MKLYANEYREPLTKIIKVDVEDENRHFYVYVRNVDFEKAVCLTKEAINIYTTDNEENWALYDLIEEQLNDNNISYKIDWEDPFDITLEA